MYFRKKLLILTFFLTFCFPINIFAYSDKIILGGDNIGISVNTKEIHVVGFYKVDGKNIGQDSGVKIGDKITHIENTPVNNINEMLSVMNKKVNNNSIKITVLRNENPISLNLTLVEDEKGIYKTGLYIKDQITGIGTLTYIDPNNKIYGALGHEITNSTNNDLIEISGGKIFKAEITGNTKSTITTTGEKNAVFYSNEVYGDIKENSKSGIYGIYSKPIDENRLIEVANPDEIKLGNATIYTVIEKNKIEKFDINILKINKNTKTKNILFEITDKKLIEKTNGVIKGMSGSPIVQNNKIIGGVTHAIVNDVNKGYGIFITTMLEEGEN